MLTSDHIEPIRDLTYGQQKMLQIILNLPQKQFQTSDVLAHSYEFDDNLSASAVLGSFVRRGYLNRLAAGRNKRWCLSESVQQQREQLLDELRELDSRGTHSESHEVVPVEQNRAVTFPTTQRLNPRPDPARYELKLPGT